MVAHTPVIGEEALARAGGAPALATGGEGEFVVAGRANDPLPQAPQGGIQEDGWWSILDLGAQRSFYCRARLLQEVPHQHMSAHARGWAVVISRWENATTKEERDVALMWLGFLPQCLQRTPPRGGRAGRKVVAKRYRLLSEGDWGGLVELWQEDEARRGGRRRRKERSSEEEKLALRREVLALLGDGKVGKAMRRVTSHGLADP